jgi:AcrR family transcriptional regulator
MATRKNNPAPKKAAQKEPAEPTRGRSAQDNRQRLRKVVDAVVQLADDGGFDAVRLREIAQLTSVSTSTLYRQFRSKEEILLFAFAEDFTTMERHFLVRPVEGDTPLERVMTLFRLMTDALAARPKYTRAVMRAMGSGQGTALNHVASQNQRMINLIVAAQLGEAVRPLSPSLTWHRGGREHMVGGLLSRVWFAALVGWPGGIYEVDTILEEVQSAAEFLLSDQAPGT